MKEIEIHNLFDELFNAIIHSENSEDYTKSNSKTTNKDSETSNNSETSNSSFTWQYTQIINGKKFSKTFSSEDEFIDFLENKDSYINSQLSNSTQEKCLHCNCSHSEKTNKNDKESTSKKGESVQTHMIVDYINYSLDNINKWVVTEEIIEQLDSLLNILKQIDSDEIKYKLSIMINKKINDVIRILNSQK